MLEEACEGLIRPVKLKEHIAHCVMFHLHAVEFICISLSHLGLHAGCLKPVV